MAINGSARIRQCRQKHRRDAHQRPSAAENGDRPHDQQNARQARHYPGELAGPERLLNKDKMRHHGDHQRDRRLQHRYDRTVHTADRRGGQHISQPPVGRAENDHVSDRTTW